MKHILLFFGFTVVLTVMTLVIINQKEKSSVRLLSVQKYYSYLYDESTDIQVSLYINDKDHPLTEIGSYSSVSLCNEDETKKLELALSKMSYGYDNTYLNEVYNEFTLNLEMPNLGEDFWINDLWIKLKLINDDEYKIKLGSFSLLIDSNNTDNLEWSALEGKKGETFFIPRLEVITIDYTHLTYEILEVKIGKDYAISFRLDQDKLILDIPYEKQLLDEIPILIYFENGYIQSIFNFKYMIEYDILAESGLIIEAYAIN